MRKFTTFSVLGLLALGGAGCAVNSQVAPAVAAEAPAAAAPAIGHSIAPFALPDTGGKTVEVGNWNQSKATVILFVATQCPVSNAYNERMENLAKTYAAKGVRFVGVNSNKQESSAEIAQHSKEHGFTFPVLKDNNNVVADRFVAKVTPEVYVVNAQGDLVYHGQIDNSQNETKVKARPLAAALDAVLANQPVTPSETSAFGCSIKRVD